MLLKTFIPIFLSFIVFFKSFLFITLFTIQQHKEIEDIIVYEMEHSKNVLAEDLNIYLNGIFNAIAFFSKNYDKHFVEDFKKKFKDIKEVQIYLFNEKNPPNWLKNKANYSNLYMKGDLFYMHVVSPIFKNGVQIGAMRFLIEFNFLSFMLRKNIKKNIENIAIINEEGKVVSHSFQNEFLVDENFLKHFNSYLKNNDQKAAKFSKKRFFNFPILGKNVHICFFYSTKNLIDKIQKQQIQAIIFALFFTLLIFLIALFLGRKITKSVNLIFSNIQDIKSLNFEKKILPYQKYFKFYEVEEILNLINQTKLAIKNFKKFIPHSLIKEIVLNSEIIKNVGRKNKMAVFFCDIRNFTNIVEKANDSILIFNQMNEYFTMLEKIINDYNGVLDKYIGDSLMVFFNAPNKIEDYEEKACLCILKCLKAIDSFNENHEYKFETNFGLNSGEMLVGNLGSNERIQYTVIGDNVNIASRLESLNKEYGTKILVSEGVAKNNSKKFFFRCVDYVFLKGKDNPVLVYELLDEFFQSEFLEFLCYQTNFAFEFFKQKDYAKAKNEYLKILEKTDDNLAKKMIENCNKMLNLF